MTAASSTLSFAPSEVYAINYAEADALPPGKVEIGLDPHHSLFDMAYYIWLIRRREAHRRTTSRPPSVWFGNAPCQQSRRPG